MACFTLSLFLCVLLYPPWQTQAFSWTSPAQNGSQVEGCAGEPMNFPWSVRLADDERVENFTYYRLLTPKPVNDTNLHGDGEQISTTDSHFRFSAKNFNLHIKRATVNDSGIYTLVLLIRKENKTRDYKRKIVLSVKAPPRTDSKGLRLETEPEAVKMTNGSSADFRVELSCGPFLDGGHPNVKVTWKTPSGKTLSSTSFHNGRFRLALSNPAEVGKYTCQVNPASPALQCAGTNDMVRMVATCSLSRAESRVVLLDAEKDELQSMVKQLQTELQKVSSAVMPATCRDARETQKLVTSGVQMLNIDGEFVNAYCDQTTDEGGWTVIQRRENGTVDFYRGWDDYANGFGDPRSEYWLGLKYIHHLTTNRTHELRVDLWAFDNTTAFAKYGLFAIAGEKDNFRLTVGVYDTNSTGGDSLAYHNNMAFSTHDRDNDKDGGSCAKRRIGAWWYKNCHYSNLNGEYVNYARVHANGITWYYWKKQDVSLKKVEMKIRPV